MNRRIFLQNTALTISGLALSGQDIIAHIYNQDPFKIKLLRGGVGVFTEKGGTIAYLITKKGLAVVDTQFPE